MDNGFQKSYLFFSLLLILFSMGISGCADQSTVHNSGVEKLRPSDGIPMVFVPSGEFHMGSLPSDGANDSTTPYPNEFPQHKVTISAFWLDKLEVSNRIKEPAHENLHSSQENIQ